MGEILFVILAVLCVILGLVMIFKPEEYYTMTEGWKYGEGAAPSEKYLKRTRAGGVVLTVAALALLAWYLVYVFSK